ncbi:MAG: hypothetical protein HN742_14200 [Lentisphaerae bacterium]|jgi:hypothetical protein|nr:hypothetical protein [Lentisphaerota bacterium]MBT4819735.1 hypothetical protein [Lentisphaerota bacterium]MBT5606621.1 hypothetical protein [Lentisphaerota bacterium]MBT7059536.1 hypothetical protein [Lentisphaerota bacterium]MBT7843027.1 hypothetical protein [Lentisphaerota bacterium]
MNRTVKALLRHISFVGVFFVVGALLMLVTGRRVSRVIQASQQVGPVAMSGEEEASGIVVDAEGVPVPGAVLHVYPVGSGSTTSDSKGRFTVRWHHTSGDHPALLLGRHVDRGLAAVLDIAENRDDIRLELSPGLTLTGVVKDEEGRPISEAATTLTAWGGNMGRSLSGVKGETGIDGRFRVYPLPPVGRFTVQVTAKRYGRAEWGFHCEQAENDELKAPEMTLRKADLNLDGIVVDQDENPVAEARVSIYGAGQPYRDTETDARGRFRLEGLCSGEVTVQSYTTDGRNGRVKTVGGASDVGIVLKDAHHVASSTPPEPPSIKGRRVSGIGDLGLRGLFHSISGKRLLLCFWDRSQRPSRHAIQELSRLNGELLARDIAVAGVDVSPGKPSDQAVGTPFMVGRTAQTEALRQSWGIRGFPWFILVSKDRKVIEDGLSLSDVHQMASADARP